MISDDALEPPRRHPRKGTHLHAPPLHDRLQQEPHREREHDVVEPGGGRGGHVPSTIRRDP